MNLILAAMINLYVSLTPQVHAEGGVGVKNGGSAIQCPMFGNSAMMLELSELLLESDRLVHPLTDREEFFKNVFRRLETVNNDYRYTLISMLKYVLHEHGPISNWGVSPIRTATIVNEDSFYSKMVTRIDYSTGRAHLKTGCIIIPISYLTPPSANNAVVPPRLIPENLALLDPFNRNVLELHEALYDIYVVLNQRQNVIVTRNLVKKILNENTPKTDFELAVREFQGVRAVTSVFGRKVSFGIPRP